MPTDFFYGIHVCHNLVVKNIFLSIKVADFLFRNPGITSSPPPFPRFFSALFLFDMATLYTALQQKFTKFHTNMSHFRHKKNCSKNLSWVAQFRVSSRYRLRTDDRQYCVQLCGSAVPRSHHHTRH